MDTRKSVLVEFKSHSATTNGGLLSAGVTVYPKRTMQDARRTYSRTDLLNFNTRQIDDLPPKLLYLIPTTLLQKTIRRKRGSREGIRNRIRRRGSKLPLPVFTLSNMRSLRNKMDELAALVKLDSDYRNTSLFFFTEIWLTEDIAVCLDDFTFIQFDRDTEITGKSIGGCLCMAVNDRRATYFTV